MSLLSIIQMIIAALVKPKQQISITEIPPGKVLDIGGGGEGVIAQIDGARVIAIDKFMSEIREARGKAPGASWMVTDGVQMPYQDSCFDNATAFFSCMYMSEDVKTGVFKETHRVLKPGGEFWIWDVNMSSKKSVFALRLQVELPQNRSIKTVYGVKAKNQSADKICKLLQEAGFEPGAIYNDKLWFFIKAKKVLNL